MHLDRAITITEQAVEFPQTVIPLVQCMYLNNLESALRYRFEQTGSMEDLDRAIMTTEQAVKSTPDAYPALAMYLHNLGIALLSRFEQTSSIEDLERAIVTNEQAFKSDTAPPSIRLKAASFCSDLLVSQRSYNRAKPILKAVVELLLTVCPRHLKRGVQQFNISRFFNITSRAVSLHLEDAEDAYKSLQLLELG